MGPCLEATYELAVVERAAGTTSNLRPSAEEVIPDSAIEVTISTERGVRLE